MPSRRSLSSQGCSLAKGPYTWVIYVCLGILVAVLLVLLFQWAQASTERFEQPKLSAVYVHMDGCGHCERFAPTWTEFKMKYGKELSDMGVQLNDFDRKDPEWEAMKIDVRGFPTVLMIKDGSVVATFNAERTVENLYSWAKNTAATSNA